MINLIKQYPGATVLTANILLALIWFLNANPLLKSGYAGADSLIDTDEDDISKIEILDPDNQGKIVRLIRGEKKPLKSQSPKKDAIVADTEKKQLQYRWHFEISANEKTERFGADLDRVRDLLRDLENTRDYYAIERTPGKDRELSMGTDNAGRFAGIQIKIWDNPNQNPESLYIGKTSARGNQSFVRLNESNEIYVAEINLRSATGSNEPYYFRNRQVLPDNIQLAQVVQIEARNDQADLNVLLGKTDKTWMLQSPVNIPADGSLVQAMLREILDWKATGFPTAMPTDIDIERSMQLSIYFKQAGNLTDQAVLHMDIKARKDLSSEYFVQIQGNEQIYRIASTYLADLFNAQERFARSSPATGPVPGLQ